MAGQKNNEFTIVIPNLSRKSALALRDSFMNLKQSIAPNATASIAIGRSENFSKTVKRCTHNLGRKNT